MTPSLPLLLISLVTFLVAWRGTGWFREYALRQRLLDHPNERSSHTRPTPRGGGLLIAATSLVGLLLLPVFGALSWSAAVGLVGGGLVVAGVGMADDRGHIAARWRLLCHFSAAAWALYWCGGLPALPVFGRDLSLGWIAPLIGALYVVWMLNLTNFMDGIDGLAAGEAVTVTLGGAAAAWLAAPDAAHWVAPVVVAAGALGFLVWNWPPARIFMGDVGSGYLGFIVAGLSLVAAQNAPRLFWAWVVLSGVFVVDATTTLFTRLARGERPYEAHRTHAYQRLALAWGGHRPVTLGVVAINVVWLLPLALLVAARRVDGLVAVVVAYIPLLVLALRSGAGKPNRP